MSLGILVVDDDALVRDAIAMLVQREVPDANVLQATSARDAIRLLAEGPIDLVLTDVAMERRDAGWEVAERARERGIAVVLLSEQREAAVRGRALSVPLLRKWELLRLGVADTIECALASQCGRVERIGGPVSAAAR
jgi:CheY-like chemotaxis protein